MMIHAYNELYLDDAMQNLGDMVEYALRDCGYAPDQFFGYFLTSGIAEKFGNGNPKYVVGMSGVELAEAVLRESDVNLVLSEDGFHLFSGQPIACHAAGTVGQIHDGIIIQAMIILL